MVELLIIILVLWTLYKALARLITPLWTVLELLAWAAAGVALWYVEQLVGAEAVLTVIVGALLIVVWALGRHTRQLREEVSQLVEELARR